MCVCVYPWQKVLHSFLKAFHIIRHVFMQLFMWWFPHQCLVSKWVLEFWLSGLASEPYQNREKVDPKFSGLLPPAVPQNKLLAILQQMFWSFCRTLRYLKHSDVVLEFLVKYGSLNDVEHSLLYTVIFICALSRPWFYLCEHELESLTNQGMTRRQVITF